MAGDRDADEPEALPQEGLVELVAQSAGEAVDLLEKVVMVSVRPKRNFCRNTEIYFGENWIFGRNYSVSAEIVRFSVFRQACFGAERAKKRRKCQNAETETLFGQTLSKRLGVVLKATFLNVHYCSNSLKLFFCEVASTPGGWSHRAYFFDILCKQY